MIQLPVKYPELVSVFVEASRNFKSIFLDNKMQTTLKTSGAHTESIDLFLRPSKIIYLVTLSF